MGDALNAALTQTGPPMIAIPGDIEYAHVGGKELDRRAVICDEVNKIFHRKQR